MAIEKIKKGLTYIAATVGTGSLATLISGLTDIGKNVTPQGYVGASTTLHGFPLHWLKKVVIVYPGNPTKYSFYSPEGLLVDIAFWSLLIGTSIAAYKGYKRYKSRK